MFLATKRFDPSGGSDQAAAPIPIKRRKTSQPATPVPELTEVHVEPEKEETEEPEQDESEESEESEEEVDSEHESDTSEEKSPYAAAPIDIDPKHASILSRFRSLVSKVAVDKLDIKEAAVQYDNELAGIATEPRKDKTTESEPVAVNRLEPLPQIKPAKSDNGPVSTLPKWIVEPEYIDPQTTHPFDGMDGLSPRLLQVLESNGWASAFAIQTAVVPSLLKDMKSISPDPLPDVLVNAYTGSGKTLAYGIPVIQALSSRVVPRIRAVIILPTKPLIQQVRTVLEQLAKGTSLRIMICRADRPFKAEQNLFASDPPDVVISTPGRIVDHIRNRTPAFTLKHLKYLVVDEADRLLNQSFQEWVSVLMDELKSTRPTQPSSEVWYRPPQKLIFSATLTRDPGKIAELDISSHSRIFIVGSASHDSEIPADDLEFSVPALLEERLVSLGTSADKPLALYQLLADNNMTHNVLVFVKSNQAAARLARLLILIDNQLYHRGLIVDRCSGELEVAQRRKKLTAFANGEIGILVCTDLIARGIDIASVEAVVNYDLPVGKREYVHRVGRTARAGSAGTAWTIAVGPGERKFFWSIAKSISRDGDVIVNEAIAMPENLQDGYQKALNGLEAEVFAK